MNRPFTLVAPMIARFSVLLPFDLYLRTDQTLRLVESAHGEYRVVLHPPCLAALNPADLSLASTAPLFSLTEQLVPAVVQQQTPPICIDDKPAISANLLQIDFQKQDFDRRDETIQRVDDPTSAGDPPPRLTFEIANSYLRRIRSLNRSPFIKVLDPTLSLWRIKYLADDGSDLEEVQGFFRARFGTNTSLHLSVLTEECWEMAIGLPDDFQLHPWEALLFDAESLLPEIGPAMALGYAALESFIRWCLEQFEAVNGLPSGLWDYINDRKPHDRQPTVEERYDVLLAILGGKSLKSETALWKAFQNLRKARNSFMHSGQAVKLDQTFVTLPEAYQMIGQAKAVIGWCEALLPEKVRRRQLSKIQTSFVKTLS